MITVAKSIVQITLTGMQMELVTVVTTVHWYLADALHVINCIGLIVMVMDYPMSVITAPIITTLSRQLNVMVGCRDDGAKSRRNKCSIYAATQG